MDSVFLEKALRLFQQHLFIDKIFLESASQHEDVVHHAQALHQMAFLLNDIHPVGAAVAVGIAVHDFAVVPHGSGGDGAVVADQADELVVPLKAAGHQPHDLPGEDLEIQIVQQPFPACLQIHMIHAQQFTFHFRFLTPAPKAG